MPFLEATALDSDYDVIVVGSGAAGGQTAYTLCMEGARVLMLEAGRRYQPETETPMLQTPDMAPLGGTATSDKPFGFHDATVSRRWEGSDIPASILEAGELFSTRVRMTRATRQLWEEREKFLKYERGWEPGHLSDDDLELLCVSDPTLPRRNSWLETNVPAL